MSKTIEITVSPKGETKIETKGYNGSDCQQATKSLEQALGVATSDVKTAEFHSSTTAQQHVQQ